MAKTKVAQRRAAAEEVCWTVLLMMALGLLEIPLEDRGLLGDAMQTWADLAVDTGVLSAETVEDCVAHAEVAS